MRILAIALGTLALAGTAVAATPAFDDASDPVYGDGWNDADFGGSGWGSGWAGITPPAVFSIGTSTANGDGDTNLDGDIDTGANRAWAITVSMAGSPANASRLTDTPLAVGQTVTVEMDHSAVPIGGTGGIRLTSTIGEARFALSWVGSTQSYSATGQDTKPVNVPYSDEGVEIAFHLTGPNSYSLDMTPLGGATTTVAGDLAPGVDVRHLILYASSSGVPETWYFNSIAVPEPGTGASALVAIAALMLLHARRHQLAITSLSHPAE